MAKRLIPVDIEEAKRLKKMLPDAKNSTENKRITIMVVYLGGKSIPQTKQILKVSSSTVENAVKGYIKNKDSFYKTNWTGRKLTAEKEELVKEVGSMIIEKNKTEENIDIMDVHRTINKKYGFEKLNYHQTRSIVRVILKSNYQKPYIKNEKQPTDAESILMERFTTAIAEIGLETNTFDGKYIKNKKTKSGRTIK